MFWEKKMSFIDASKGLVKGDKIARDNKVWESKGLFVTEEDGVIYINNSQGTKSVFSPSPEDFEMEDWFIL